MSANGKVTLFDLPTKKEQYGCWSPNVWKTRLVLNYKQIPYETKWLKHPEIAPTLEALGQSPNPPKPAGQPGPNISPYTCPAVQFPDGSTSMDSALIAPEVEKRYPEPSLHLDNNLHNKVMPVLGQVMMPLLGVLFPRIGREVLIDEVVPVWRAKREGQFGCTIEEFEAAKGGEPAWKAAEPGFQALSQFLREHKKDEGPFLLGSQVCYGDFIIAAMMESCKRIGEDIYERIATYDESLVKLHQACAQWCKGDR